MTRCHVPGCTRRAPDGRLMCGPHWKLVPRRLQRDVWRTFRPEHLQPGGAASSDYLAAAKAALEAADKALPRAQPKQESHQHATD